MSTLYYTSTPIAKPTRQVGSIADFDPVAAEKSTHRGPAAPASATGTVVYSSASTASATPTPAPPAADVAAPAAKSGYGRSGYGRSVGNTPGATGLRTSAIESPAAAPAAAPAIPTVVQVQSVASRPTSVQQPQQPTPPPVVAASNTPPPAIEPRQSPPQQLLATAQPAATGVQVRNSTSAEVNTLSQDVARLSVGASGDQTVAPAETPAAVAPTPVSPPVAATSGPCYRAIYDYDATDEDEVSILVSYVF